MATGARDTELPLPLFGHPYIPTPSWEPRCEICRLARDCPEAYEWVTRELLAQRRTQQQIAVELLTRWQVDTTQPQLSRHRVRHLLPDLRDAHEAYVTTMTVLQHLGDVDPVEQATRLAQVTQLRMFKRFEEAGDPREAARLSAEIARLGKVAIDGAGARISQEAEEEALRLKRLERELAEGDYQRAVVGFIEQHYPHLKAAILEELDGDGSSD